MRTYLSYFLVLVLAVLTLQNCGPSAEEIAAREKAVADSLAKVRADSIAAAQAEAARIAAEQERLRQEAAERERRRIEFDENGPVAIQVESWRNEGKAQLKVQTWKDRGFENAYVVKFGSEVSGEIWFRVRLGRFADRAMAEKQAALLLEDYNQKSWISSASAGESASDDAGNG